ncbi:MAG TPA: anthranilate synthase component I [Thermomicrobiales bacterium]|nr:anthranilate synthase component I [Thermomicrobiales bacterium]
METTAVAEFRTAADIVPPIDEVRRIAADAGPEIRTVPVYREILADMETPVSVYLKLSDGAREPGFLLESVEGGTHIARYSFIGSGAAGNVTFREGTLDVEGDISGPASYDDPLVALQQLIAPFRSAANPKLPRFTGGAVGYLSFDAIRRFEPRVPKASRPGLGLPEARFQIADTLVVFDHLERMLKVVSHVSLNDDTSLEDAYGAAAERIDRLTAKLNGPAPEYEIEGTASESTVEERLRPNMTADEYREMVRKGQEYIYQGDIFQVVLSQRVDVDTPAHPFSLYRALRTVNPSPYMFFLDFADHQIVGASPELLVRVEDDTVSNHPIAGTRPRGKDDAEDARLAEELMADEKEKAEHIMLVDLGRNDVGRVSVPGSVRLPKLMGVERFSHVMHIVSNVDGTLRPDLTALDALRACFPAGTVSGAPKVRAMEIIAELEQDARGVYSGAVGYVDFGGEMDTCIALRTMVYRDGVASLQAGGGIVADSTPEGEYAESFHKMRALIRAIERAEELEARRALAATEVK